MSKELKIDFGKQDFNVGDKVVIDWKKKDYEGKSNRRRAIDAVMEYWRLNSVMNLQTEVERNFTYKFGSTKKTLKVFSEILSGKRACEDSVFKRHDQAKDYVKSIIEALDNVQGAIVTGISAQFHHADKHSPSNVCYVEAGGQFSHEPLYIYTVMIHGFSGKNHIQFLVELFDEDMKLA